MATTKTRINISLSKPLIKTLRDLAKRDDVPVATKTSELVKWALEMEEDFMLGEIAKRREKVTRQWISHEKAWPSTK